MATKEPVLLTVLIQTRELRWFVAGVGLDGKASPLICSEPGNLRPYLGVTFDEQVSFLRHRLSGVLQRGCDRVWGREQKPCQIVFVADAPLADADPELTPRVAEHFVTWMTKPPVVFFTTGGNTFADGPQALVKVAGDLDAAHRTALDRGLADLLAALGQPEVWELAPVKKHPAE